jgi:hypothetical protein
MKRFECWAGVVCLGAGGVMAARGIAPRALEADLPEVLLAWGVGILGLGLLRDLYVLVTRGRGQCLACRGELKLCTESVFGVALVALGLLALLLNVQRMFVLSAGAIAMNAGAVLVISGLIRDRILVLTREEDHRRISV